MFASVLALGLAGAPVGVGQYPLEPPPKILIPCPPARPVAPPRVTEIPPAQPHVAEKAAPKPDVILRWNGVALAAIKAERTPPPVAARNLAIVHVAIYDAVNAVARTHQPFRVAMGPPPGTSAEAAAAIAAHRTLLTLYPKQVAQFDAALDASLDAIPEGAAKTDGISLGFGVAEKILQWRQRDGRMQSAAYTPHHVAGRWQPTPPDFRAALLPEWTAVVPFAVRDSAEFRPAGPPALTSEEFLASFKQVKELGAARSKTRTADQTEVARFWADGDGTATPPGHWNRIAGAVAVDRGQSLADNARLFAMLNVALADAAIVCWDCKFKFDFWRPITAIRNADQLNNASLKADADWEPLLTTPPFPSYTSGHSTFSGAAAAVLTAFFGGDKARFISTSDGLPGVTRSFDSFKAAAEEAGMSRIYGGIHYDFDNRDGMKVGRKVGEYVAAKYFQKR